MDTQIKGFFKMTGQAGTEYWLALDKISAFGLDPGPRFFVICDGKEFSTLDRAKLQFKDFFDVFLSSMQPNRITGPVV